MNSTQEKKYFYLAIGVFKLDFKVAGYPEIVKTAREWSEQKGFRSLIIRKVSKDNFGIQFVYIQEDAHAPKISMFRHDLERRFGIGLYAVDYQETEEEADISERLKDWVIVDHPLS